MTYLVTLKELAAGAVLHEQPNKPQDLQNQFLILWCKVVELELALLCASYSKAVAVAESGQDADILLGNGDPGMHVAMEVAPDTDWAENAD